MQGDRVLAERIEPMARGQAERLFPFLEELLSQAGVDWHDLAAICVGTGPGNFTGIRISVAAARGLALGLNIPAIGITATQAAACDLPRPCRVTVPLRGDEVVWQDFFAAEGGAVRAGLGHEDNANETLGAAAPPPHAGPKIATSGDLPPGPPCLTPVLPVAVAIARLAARRLPLASSLPRPAPVYLRPANAAPPKDLPPPLLP